MSWKFLSLCCTAALGLAASSSSLVPSVAAPPAWQSAGKGPLWAVSGLAVVEALPGKTVLLAVHDNKQPGEVRVSLVTRKAGKPARMEKLTWDGKKLPVDLEAATAILGSDGEFWLAESKGRIWRVRLDRAARSVQVEGSFTLPNATADQEFEGFDLAMCGERVVAMWGHRGGRGSPALLYWAECNPAPETSGSALPKFGEVRVAELRVPWPAQPARPISELKLDPSGAVYLTAALDGGDDGPFASALYMAGTLRADGKALRFIQNLDPPRLWASENRKVEGFALLPGSVGGIVLGTDDEHRGGALLFLP